MSSIKSNLTKDDLPHFLLLGSAGTGKTSTAYAMARTYFGADWSDHFHEFNASDERGIDFVRNEVKRLCEFKGKRFILLDEGDRITPEGQDAMRRIMENTHGTTIIIAGNSEHKIIDPIKSRCCIYKFKKLTPEIVERRIKEVIKQEGITFNVQTPKDREGIVDGLKALVEYADGDLRLALNTLEKIVGSNKLLSPAEVMMFRESGLSAKALDTALEGDFNTALQLLEDSYILHGQSGGSIIQDFYKRLKIMNHIDPQVRIKLFDRLAQTEGRIKVGSTPLVQLAGFLSFCYIAPHLKKEEVPNP